MRTWATLATLGALAGTAAAEEDLALIARDGEIARVAPLAEVEVGGKQVDNTEIDRLRVIENNDFELRGLLCDHAACLVVTVDAQHVELVLQEPVVVELADSTGVQLATGATVSASYYKSAALMIRMELVGATRGTSYREDGARPFEVQADVTLDEGTWIVDPGGDTLASVLSPLPARVIRKDDAGTLVEVTDGTAKVVGFARSTGVKRLAPPALREKKKRPKKKKAYSTRLVAGTVLYREPGGETAGVVLHPASVRRATGDAAWSGWTAWTIEVDGITAKVWTEGTPLVKEERKKTKKKVKKKRKKRPPATSRT